MPTRLVKYFVPALNILNMLCVVVDDQSLVLYILEHFRSLPNSNVSSTARIAFLPKDVALEIKPTYNLTDRLAAIASSLVYPDIGVKLLSLELWEEGDSDHIQFFIQNDPDEPEFMPLAEERDHLRIIQHAFSGEVAPSLSPSDFRMRQEDYCPIYNGRPAHLTGPPITIYDEVFADIVDDLTCLSERPLNEDILATIGSFTLKSLEIYDTERERESAMYSLVETLLGVKLRRNVYMFGDSTKVYAVVEEDGAIYMHLECNNESGLSGIVNYEGPVTLLRHIVEPKYAAIRNHTSCPCIHISISGPYVSFGASILTDMYIYQSFTNCIYLGGNPSMTDSIYNTAKIFDIFRNALGKMRDKYKRLRLYDWTSKDSSRLFPRPAYMPNTMIPNIVFDKHFIPDRPDPEDARARRALFHAKYNGQPVVVKFSERYHPDAHRAVAEVGLAPRLLFHTRLRGGVHMVIMDYIHGSDAQRQFEDQVLPDSVVKQVEAALAVLHKKNLVHGDIRCPNILVKMKPRVTSPESEASMDIDTPEPTQSDWQTYLVGFDGVGEERKDRYTPFLNKEISWPAGVRPGGLMEREHDIAMLQKLKHTGPNAY